MKTKKSRWKTQAPIFAALGDPIRLGIISQLCSEGPLPTVRLKQVTTVSRQGITKHLQLLEQAGIVKSERMGRDRLWRMQTRQLADVRQYLEQISAQWDATLEQLRKFVEDDRN